MKNPVFTGAGVAIITPMYEDGSINFDELGRIVEDQIARGTDAIVICGTTGECSTMTDEEQLAAIKYTVDLVNHRVPVSDGHTAAVFVSFEKKPSKEEILKAWAEFRGPAQELELPSAPKQFLHYFEENDRPQPKLDRNTEHGMAVCIGRLREDTLFDYKFACMSHNTLRGAAGGAVLLAELLAAKGYFD